jgi:probable HAF family extracellular repeat protein
MGGLGQQHAVLWDHGTMTDLGTLPGGTHSEAYGINNEGQVVGLSNGAGFSGRHAVLWDQGAVTDLGTLPGGLQSRASGINARGEVVGRGDVAAILWTISRP